MFVPPKDSYQFEPGTGVFVSQRLHSTQESVQGAQIPARPLVRQPGPMNVWCAASVGT